MAAPAERRAHAPDDDRANAPDDHQASTPDDELASEPLGHQARALDDYRASAEFRRRAGSFGAAAAVYAEHRPDYPAAAIGWALEPVAGRRSGQLRVLDLGAGTGKLTAQLARLEIGGGPMAVLAVEPDPQMLAELRRRLPGITALAGPAESIPLPDASVDAVLAGQAAHWFDLDRAMPEIARVLVSGGLLAGLWNNDDDRVDWVAGLHRATGYHSVVALSSGLASSKDALTRWLGAAGREPFGPPAQAGFSHAHRRTAESLIETLATQSMFLIMEPAEREAALRRATEYLAATPQTASGEFSLPLYTYAVRTIRS